MKKTVSRRDVLRGGAGCAAVWTMAGAGARVFGQPVAAGAGKNAFAPLRLGEILPAGWLRRQLEIQAAGMGGHLDEFWPDVGANSGWLGGTGESWERGPYFLDGLYPLAVQLGDARLKAKAMRFVEWTLASQQPDGNFGPQRNLDWWPRMVMLKALQQHYEASGDRRVIELMTRYFHFQLGALPTRPLSSWGKYRWQDEAMVVVWLYRQTRDAALPKLFALLQQQGYDWVEEFRAFPYKEAQTRELLKMVPGAADPPHAMETHGVNNGQALKAAAVRFQNSGDAEERANFDRQLASLWEFHGVPNGMFSCDEHLAGLNPSQGTELCTVVETMFSLEVALAAFGDAKLGDRLETIAFNALPGTFTDDMWAHQYDQQSNQVRVSRNSKPWTTNGPESNLYGLEPNFGCCTANFHQGWPKLTSHLWMRTPDDGLTAVVWAPCTVETTVKGARVRLAVATEYPFRNTAEVRVESEAPVRFPLALRIPEWSARTRVRVNGAEVSDEVRAGSFHRVERTWKKGDRVEVEFEMKPFLTRGFHRSVTVRRGPLVFSHAPEEAWVKLREHGPTADWQVFGTTPWNYALAVDEQTIAKAAVHETAVGERPFSAKGAGVTVSVPARRLLSWTDVDGVAGAVPEDVSRASETVETLTLIPYAAAKLRITAFPQVTPG